MSLQGKTRSRPKETRPCFFLGNLLFSWTKKKNCHFVTLSGEKGVFRSFTLNRRKGGAAKVKAKNVFL
jgi:hypothetical protein